MNETLESICTECVKNTTLNAKEMEEQKKISTNITEKIYILFFLVLCIIYMFIVRLYKIKAYKKSLRCGPVTRHPIIPFPQEGLKIFQGSHKFRNMIPEARIQCGHADMNIDGWFISGSESVNKKMESIMRMVFDLKNFHGDVVPRNARTISIKMENFEHGLNSNDFEPIGGEAPESYYTYQMFGDNRIQVTNYVEDEVFYVAGFCIYIENPCIRGSEFPSDVVKFCINYLKYPGRRPNRQSAIRGTNHSEEESKDVTPSGNLNLQESNETRQLLANETNNATNEGSSISNRPSPPVLASTSELVVRYCPKIQRNTMSSLKSGLVIHQEWDKNMKKMRNEECQMCSELLNDEEPPPYSSLSLV